MFSKLINHKLFKTILIATLALILGFIFILDNDSSGEEELSELTSDLYDEEVVNSSGVNIPAHSFSQIPSTRKLKDYYSRRQYPGSPPIIPHPLTEAEGDFNCMNCHDSGGYVPKFSAYTPITPHPQFVNCQQCHVSEANKNVFNAFDTWGRNGKAEIDWVSVMPVKIKRSAIAGGPPPIPHSLQLRENCLTCHAGPAAVKQIRTSHPERVNCTQCHVPQKNIESWVRR